MSFWEYYILSLINYSSRSSGMRYERLLETCHEDRIKSVEELHKILQTLLEQFLIFNIGDEVQQGLFFVTPEGRKQSEQLRAVYQQQLHQLINDST